MMDAHERTTEPLPLLDDGVIPRGVGGYPGWWHTAIRIKRRILLPWLRFKSRWDIFWHTW